MLGNDTHVCLKYSENHGKDDVMLKTLKRTLALILAVMLCLGAIPFSAFAAEMPTAEEISSAAPSSESPEGSSQPDEGMDVSSSSGGSQP